MIPAVMSRRRLIVAATTAIACLFTVGPAQSQIVIDRIAASGGWASPTAWSGGNVPDNNPTPESARFAIDASYTLLFTFEPPNPITIEDLLVVAGEIEFLVSQLVFPGPREFTLNQTLSVDNGSLKIVGDQLAPFNFLEKEPIVISATGELGFDYGVLIAEQGIDNSSGGVFKLGRSTTTRTATTTLRLTGGVSTLSLPGQPFSLAGPEGAVLEVDGVGTTAAVGDLRVDEQRVMCSGCGAGEIRVTSGGQLTSSTAEIAQNSGTLGISEAVVISGSQSSWINSGLLQVGETGIQPAKVLVNGGGAIQSGSLAIARDPTDAGTVTLLDAGSSLTAGDVYLGGSAGGAGGTGQLVVNNQTEAVISGGLTIYNGGTLILDGGPLTTHTISNADGGLLDFRSGRLQVDSGLTIGEGAGPGVLLPDDLTVAVNRTYATTGTTTILPGKLLTLEDGKFVTGSLDIQGDFLWRSGTLGLTGGEIIGLSNLIVPVNGTLEASGTTIIPLTAVAGSSITLVGDATLGDPTAFNGAFVESTVTVGQHTLTLQDANDVVFDSGALVTLGESGSAGALVAANGLTLDFGGNIAGHGTVDTPNDPAKPFINNGNVTGNSLAEPLTLPGYVKGVGSFDNVEFTGTFSPGFSSAKVNLGSAVYDGMLHIEIGGLAPGSGHDQLNHILGDGIANLGGTLEVSLLGGFLPAAGDAFEIVTAAGGISGTFVNAILPALAGDLFWNVNYSANSVTLAVAAPGIPGDYNGDGTVDAADYTVWRDGLGGAFGAGDYLVWKNNFGATEASGSAANTGAVPEPSAILLAGIAIALFMSRGTMCRTAVSHVVRRLRSPLPRILWAGR